jgi:3-oxoacyl-[acyl-carrier-protein] synthase II
LIRHLSTCRSPPRSRDFDWKAELNPKDSNTFRAQFHLHLQRRAKRCAIPEFRIDELSLDQKRMFGVVLGTGGGGLHLPRSNSGYWFSGNAGKGKHLHDPRVDTTADCLPSFRWCFNIHGLSHVVSTGCTSSTDAMFYAAQHIALGRQDMMLTGGVDCPISPGILKGFEVMTVCTKEWNNEPERACRPFSKDRSGIVIGEGSWIYVLESYDHAIARGAKIYAEIIGYGVTCDAYHRVRLEANGIEPSRAMTLALNDAGIAPEDVDYINLHGTSTQLNDRIETHAAKLAFGDAAYDIPMSATKSQIGHPQGATGAAGIGATLLAINKSILPPTINLDVPDPDCDLDYVANRSREAEVNIALCNCIGFGSKNSALILQKV